jgi:hypothetical protein
MKSTYLGPLASVALLLGCATAYAQTPSDSAADPSAMSPTSTQGDTTKGNKVVGDPQPARADPLTTTPTAGQDKATGNDLVSSDKSHKTHGTGTRPDFGTLDTKNNGYVTAHDVKSNQWLAKNFARCDSDHDGHLSQQEYANCH